MKIFKKYTFDSAHFLPNVSETHKCKRMHGHTYHLTVFIEGKIDEKYGWIIDFNDLKSVVNPVIEQLDHHVLNEIEGLENPTCEILAKWLYDKIKSDVPFLESIEVYETPTSGAIYSR